MKELLMHWKIPKKFEREVDFDKEVEDLLFERYFVHKKPLFARLPFSYKIIPVFIRNFLFSILNKSKKDTGFPKWPIDNSADLIREKYMKLLKKEAKKKIPYISFWPNKKKFAFCITHDMETKTSFDSIEKIREIERKYGFISSWNVLCNEYDIDFEKLRKLKQEGCEIALHGYNHDGKLPYLSEKRIDNDIQKCLSILKEFKITSFRSPQLQRNENFLKQLSKYFICDSSVPDTDIKGAFAMRSGCCSVFPFMINNMAEIPLTVPQDFRMIYTLKSSDNEYLKIWKEKIDFIKSAGGIVNILIHPDDYISGNEKQLRIYDKILSYISKQKGCYHANISEIAKWWIERDKCEIIGDKIRGSSRAMINYI